MKQDINMACAFSQCNECGEVSEPNSIDSVCENCGSKNTTEHIDVDI